MEKIQFAFFGTSRFSVIILDELKSRGFIPKVIVTSPDKPKGRHLVMTSSETKVWAEDNNIPCLEPTTLKTSEFEVKISSEGPFDVFIVASYGKIIPENILKIPKRETLNVHPSLLPKLRGASPIQSAILEENVTGVSIMHLDAEMDHGPIVTQKKLDILPYSLKEPELEDILAHVGGELLAEILPAWVKGELNETPQDHSLATFTKKINKEDGELDLLGDPLKNFRKIQAFATWPGTHFFVQKDDKTIRVTIKAALLKDGELKITRIIPEGKKEMDYQDFVRNL